jgi:hypothetical protein
MPDPVIRRLPCAATLYLELSPDGLSLARLVVDVAMPDPSVIVANLPASFDPDRGDAWEGEDVDPAPCPRPLPVVLSFEARPQGPAFEVA